MDYGFARRVPAIYITVHPGALQQVLPLSCASPSARRRLKV